MFIYKKVFLLTFALSVWTSEGRGGAKPSEPVRTAVAIIENGNYQICAGTILSNYWVLAATQCYTIIYSCLCGSHLESVQEGNGENDI